MKRLTQEWFDENYPKIKALLEENPMWLGAAPELRSIKHWVEKLGYADMDLINKICIGMPLTLVLKLRAHGIDIPKYEYGEPLED